MNIPKFKLGIWCGKNKLWCGWTLELFLYKALFGAAVSL